jgi:hypothetical protein
VRPRAELDDAGVRRVVDQLDDDSSALTFQLARSWPRSVGELHDDAAAALGAHPEAALTAPSRTAPRALELRGQLLDADRDHVGTHGPPTARAATTSTQPMSLTRSTNGGRVGEQAAFGCACPCASPRREEASPVRGERLTGELRLGVRERHLGQLDLAELLDAARLSVAKPVPDHHERLRAELVPDVGRSCPRRRPCRPRPDHPVEPVGAHAELRVQVLAQPSITSATRLSTSTFSLRTAAPARTGTDIALVQRADRDGHRDARRGRAGQRPPRLLARRRELDIARAVSVRPDVDQFVPSGVICSVMVPPPNVPCAANRAFSAFVMSTGELDSFAFSAPRRRPLPSWRRTRCGARRARAMR